MEYVLKWETCHLDHSLSLVYLHSFLFKIVRLKLVLTCFCKKLSYLRCSEWCNLWFTIKKKSRSKMADIQVVISYRANMKNLLSFPILSPTCILTLLLKVWRDSYYLRPKNKQLNSNDDWCCSYSVLEC